MITTDWLSLTEEQALEPELPIIDPHQHFWDRNGERYLLDELALDVAAHNVRQTLFVECVSMYRAEGAEEFRVVGETEFAQGLAAVSASGQHGDLRAAAGIVAAADLRLGDRVAAVIEAHLSAAPQRLRGIRHRLARADLPDPSRRARAELMEDPNFRAGFAQLRLYGLVFDAWVYHPQLPQLTELARAFPETTIVLNHLGGPLGVGPFAGQRDQVYEVWRHDIAELAQCPNVFVKLGGLLQPAVNGSDWHERQRPPTSDELLASSHDWYLYAIEQFGPDRCMFESNFPVDRRSCSYTVLWNQFKKLTVSFTEGERAALFHDTALRVYRLARR